MSDGRTFWYPEDARWLSWERVVMLGEEFGAAAISVLVAVKCEAKLQNAGWRVKAGWRSLGREAFVDPDIVHSIVVRAAELGVLDDLEEKDEFTFTARVSGMAASERKARDAARKAAARAVADGADTCGHDRTPEDKSDATGPREEKRREEDTETTDVVSDKREPRKTVDQDSLPPDLTPDLAAAATAAHARLLAVFDERGGTKPSLRAVGLAVRRYPDRDHNRVVGELEHWALAGLGQRRPVRDWAKTLATFLDRAPTGKAPTLGTVGVMDNGLAERTARRRAIIEGGAA